jgi:hypothetical protein
MIDNEIVKKSHPANLGYNPTCSNFHLIPSHSFAQMAFSIMVANGYNKVCKISLLYGYP